MIDSHCHLNADVYRGDLGAVVGRAEEAGVVGIFVPGIGIEEARRGVEIADLFPVVRAAVGIHPHEARQWSDEVEREIRDLSCHPKVGAIGEIGLDFYRDWCPPEDQRRAFRAQLRLAKELDLPVVIHDRDAHEEILATLEEPEHRGIRGVMHCFSGGPTEAARTLSLGLHLSFTGALTYGKGKADRVLRAVSLENLLLETDAPWMTPIPHRGERNEPAFVSHVADALAEKLGKSRAEVIEVTTHSAARLFGFAQLLSRPRPESML